ncbi:MAG: sulfotransferase, partial [Phenylobacterium sp.]|nr:sulfotransferase [Phenylobacterium sp.]
KAGQAYLQMVGARLAGAGRSVDRAPLNIIWAGLIHRAMPQARIVGLRRHPMDACMETYRRLLPTDPSFDYAYDLTHTAAYYAGFERLMAHWRQVLPAERFTAVALEDLVADPEGETRRLLDFCGLDFDPNCLAQGSAAAPGGSALMATHANSIGRWRSYGPGLAPLREALESAGVRL